MKRLIVYAVAVCVPLLVTSALAQDEEIELEKDLLEVAIFGGIGSPVSGIDEFQVDLGAKSGFNLGGEIGYFVSLNFVIGLSFQYNQFGVDNDFDGQLTQHHNLYSSALYAKYSLPGESNWEPYFIGRIGLDFPKFSTFVTNTAGDRWRELSYDPVFGVGGGAGIFYFTSDYSGLFLEVNYHHAFSSSTTATYQDSETNFGENISVVDIHAGIRVFFGPGS